MGEIWCRGVLLGHVVLDGEGVLPENGGAGGDNLGAAVHTGQGERGQEGAGLGWSRSIEGEVLEGFPAVLGGEVAGALEELLEEVLEGLGGESGRHPGRFTEGGGDDGECEDKGGPEY